MSWLVLAGLVAYGLSGVVGAMRPAGRLGTQIAVAGSVAYAALACAALAGDPLSWSGRLGPAPFLLQLWLPPLSALFVLLISVVSALALVYGGTSARHLAAPKGRMVAALGPVFVAAMTLVPLAANFPTFLIAWEAMALTSFGLVMTDADRPGVLGAGYIYLVMTHIGALCLLAAFLLLANATGAANFAAWALAAPRLSGGLRSGVFVLMLLGFGSKAALVPLHEWLPRAHPVAPSHVSALMSGVMLKEAIYGLVLLGIVVLGPGPLWWGVIVLGLGVVSALLGVLYALAEQDLKRLLAYCSVENIGISTLGFGVALIAVHLHLPLLAALALAAALYHTVSHALFKTALFLDAGSIQAAGAGRQLDHMGGLLRRLPWTGVSLLVAAAAASGLPLFNGFVGEWLTYQSLVRLASAGGGALALCAMGGVLALALTGGLVAACFVKVIGVGLLGRPRTPAAASASEVPAAMTAPPLILAGLCVVFGLVPGLLALPLGRLAAAVVHPEGAIPGAAGALLITALPWPGAQLAPQVFAAAAAAVFLIAACALTAGRRERAAPSVREPWACGGVLALESQYSATAYAKPFRQVFSLVYLPVRSLRTESAVHPFFRTRVTYEGGITPVFERYVYTPARRAVLVLARQGRRLQSGSLRLYLGYILVTLLLLLAFAR